MRPPKILHIIGTARSEGTPNLVLHWLGVSGPTQEVLALRDHPNDLEPRLRAGASWYHAAVGMPSGKTKHLWILLLVLRVCLKRKPDVVVCWNNGFSPPVLSGAWLAGVGHLLTHGGNPPTLTPKGHWYTAYTTLVLKFIGARMVCCSRYVESAFAKSPGAIRSVLTTIYNCTPVDKIARLAEAARTDRPKQAPRLIMVATLEAHKDHATLLTAMTIVLRHIPEVELSIVGDGSLRNHLVELAGKLGLADSVKFLGTRSDVPALLGQSDVFVFSTTPQEGLPGVLLEAMAASLPIIASDVPPVRETLENGRWGTLVEQGNADALAGAIMGMLKQENRTSRMPDDLRKYLSAFRAEKMLDEYLRASEVTDAGSAC